MLREAGYSTSHPEILQKLLVLSYQLLFSLFFLIILLMLITSASLGVSPAKWVNVLISVCLHLLFGPILVFISVSSLESLWALSCCVVSYCWWEGIQMELLGM